MKNLKIFLLAGNILFFSSCGTICGGRITECQKQRPAPGQPTRQIRVAALVFDCLSIFAPIDLAVDFADGAMYKPCKNVGSTGK